MSRIRIVVVLATAAVLLVGAFLVLTKGPGHGAGDDATSTAARGSSSAAQDGSGSKGHRPSELQQKPVAPATSGARGGGREGGEASGPIGGRLAPPVKKGPLVPAALPRSASSVGRLVSGYPHEVLPPLPGSRVRSSSVSPSGRAVQVALVGATSRGQDSVAKFYRLRLARYGFKESPLPAVGGSTALGFERGKDSVVLTLTPQGRTKCTYSVFGVLHAGAA